MAEKLSNPCRRWFRFSLRTLFVVVTSAAVFAALAKANPQFAIALPIVLAVSVVALMAMTLLAFWEWIVFRALNACHRAILRRKGSPATQADPDE